MTPTLTTTIRKLSGGATWGLVVGALGGAILTGATVTAEAGQVLWLIAVVAAAVVISPSGGGGVRKSVGVCLPFFLALCSVLTWTGATWLAWSVGKAIVVARIRIPLAAYTERELAIRHGTFFIFVIVASLPATVGSLIVWQETTRIFRALLTGSSWRSRHGKAIEALRLAFRLVVCAGMLTLAVVS